MKRTNYDSLQCVDFCMTLLLRLLNFPVHNIMATKNCTITASVYEATLTYCKFKGGLPVLMWLNLILKNKRNYLTNMKLINTIRFDV
jgi:hypothetical protein